MDLTQYSGGDYLQAGYHKVRVQSMRHFTYTKGSPGVEYRLTDGRRSVKLGLRNWRYAELQDGLSEGEAIVVSLDRVGVEAGKRAIIDEEGAGAGS